MEDTFWLFEPFCRWEIGYCQGNSSAEVFVEQDAFVEGVGDADFAPLPAILQIPEILWLCVVDALSRARRLSLAQYSQPPRASS